MSDKENSLDLVAVGAELTAQLKNDGVRRALLATTFKGLDENNMRKAAMEGMMRGFTFKNFLEKDVYALPYGKDYSLVESIDYVRKIGMRAGIVGKGAPVYTYSEDGKIESCSVTIKRMANNYVGEYTATVFFSEFTTGRNLWSSKPRMMIAKVAEMHALRMACPEELAHSYIEEEMDKEAAIKHQDVRVENAVEESKGIKMGKYAKENDEENQIGQSDDAESIEV